MADTLTDSTVAPASPTAAAPAGASPAAAAPPPGFAAGELDVFAPTYVFPRLELVSGKGARVTDATGREYLDFVSGIAVNAFGHAPKGLKRVDQVLEAVEQGKGRIGVGRL